MKRYKIYLILSVIFIDLSICFLVLAWTEPSQLPPSGNVPEPLNVSSSSQTKTGNLTLPNLYLNATGNEGNIYYINELVGYNDIFLKGNSAGTAPVYLAGNRISFYINNSEIVKIDSSKLEVNGAIKIGNTNDTNAGTIRWTGSDFEGYTGTEWVSLTAGTGGTSYWTKSGTSLYPNETSWDVGIGLPGVDSNYRLTVEDKGIKITNTGTNHSFYVEDEASDSTPFVIDSSGNVGIGTTNPAAKLTIVDGAILASGSTGGTPTSGQGTRLMWIPAKAAFRAGYVDGTQWNDSNIGYYSLAIGYNTKASGWYSIAMGEGSIASGYASIAMGESSTASDRYTFAIGLQTTASGQSAIAMGYSSTASGIYSIAAGDFVTSSGDHSIAIGGSTVASGSWSIAIGQRIRAEGDHSVAIALSDQNGTAVTQANTMAIMGGKVGIDTTTPSEKLEVAGNIGIKAGNDAFIGTLDNHALSLKTNNTTRIYITNDGNVGIGTTNPSYKLDVAGTINVTGFRMPTGAAAGRVLTSDASGVGTWQPASGVGVPSGAYVAFPDPNPRSGWTYTGYYETKGSDAWTTKAPMPTARTGLAAAVVNNKIYAIGGQTGSISHLSTNEEYDPSTNSWTTKASMPTARYGLGVAVVNNKIYAIGGSRDYCYSANEEYDPSTNTWTTKAPMPTGRWGLAAAVVNNKIYAIGGFCGTSTFSTNEEYDPSTNSWTTKASMPTARYGLGVAVVNNKIYAIGGRNSSGYLSTNQEYDPSTNSWTTKASMPTGRNFLAAAAVNNKIYAIGGSNSSGSLSTNEEYDPSTNSWTTKAPMPTARYGLGVAVVNNKIYAIGGTSSSSYETTINEEYTPPLIFYWFQKD